MNKYQLNNNYIIYKYNNKTMLINIVHGIDYIATELNQNESHVIDLINSNHNFDLQLNNYYNKNL